MAGPTAMETPLMKQYSAIRAKYPGALLLFRVGDFYETFGEDAIKASGIKAVHIMQPSVLLGFRNEKRRGEAMLQGIMKFFSFALVGKGQKYKSIHGKVLAQAMVNAAKKNVEGNFTYQYNDIVQLANPSQY